MADLYTTRLTARKELLILLNSGNMHVTLFDALNGIPARVRGIKPEGLPYSIWQLTDHVRITQWDKLKYCTNPLHVSPKWPDGYWSKSLAPKDEDEWQACVDQVYSDRQKFIDIIADEGQDIFEPFENEEDQNLFRQALFIADHTAYHLGQIIILRRLLRVWH